MARAFCALCAIMLLSIGCQTAHPAAASGVSEQPQSSDEPDASSAHDASAVGDVVTPNDVPDATPDATPAADASTDWPDGGYDLISIDGCDPPPIGPGFAYAPVHFCDWNITRDRRLCSTEGAITCLRAEDCTEEPFGHCEGAIFSQCDYAQASEPCAVDSDCTQLPDGVCLPPTDVEPFCDADGNNCHAHEPYCHYLVLNQVCTRDDECVAAPGGFCKRNVWLTRCRYFGCEDDGDCATGERCECHSCWPSECRSDGECGADQHCVRAEPCMFVSGGFYCTKPEDECASSADCAQGTHCDHDEARGIFACIDVFCPTTIE